MNLSEILQFILLPVVGWLLLNSFQIERRLTRIETLLEQLNYKSKNKYDC